MGAHITSVNGNLCAPLKIEPGTLHGIDYTSPVASAQVKSAILLAGLYADGETSVTEPALSRSCIVVAPFIEAVPPSDNIYNR